MKSIEVNQPSAKVFLFSNILKETDFVNLAHNFSIVRWDYNTLADSTGLGQDMPNSQDNWCLWSDVFRVVCLYRWGGTYFDADDIMVRPLPPGNNLLPACFLSQTQHELWRPNPVVQGIYASNRGKLSPETSFRIGADPLTNFAPNNQFLRRWMTQFPNTAPIDRGQVLPTRLLAADPDWAVKHVSPTNWTDLLYQPYEGGHHQADQRYSGNRIFTELTTTKREYIERRDAVLSHYGFYLVKNHGFRMHRRTGSTQQFLAWFVQELWDTFSAARR